MLGSHTTDKHALLCSSQEWSTYGVRAVFSDETEQFRTPFEPKSGDEVKIKLRTWKNSVQSAALICDEEEISMKFLYSEGAFDYYEGKVIAGTQPMYYYFRLCWNDKLFYYNKIGLSKEVPTTGKFIILPGFSVPKWARGAIMYQIFADRFYNGDPANDVETREYYYLGNYSKQVTDWNKPPAADGVREFYGGDIQGIIDKLDYLQDLGVEVLYLNPIFVSPSNHKYDTQDYEYVDPHLGTIVHDGGALLKYDEKDNKLAKKYIRRVTDKKNLEASNKKFIELVTELHKRGMKVILDGVFNHCGSFNKWMDREHIYNTEKGYQPGAYVSKDSPYNSYFKFTKQNWPDNKDYEAWWGFETLPKLNFEESKELEEAILNIGKKWVSEPFCIDGWRMDVAADLGHSPEYNHKFWKMYREAVKTANPEAIILAEHYGDPSPWLEGDQWDTVMNYDAFMEPVTWFLTGVEKHSDYYKSELEGNGKAFNDSLLANMAKFSGPSLYSAMNELSNHDHSRFMTRTSRKVGRVKELGPVAAGENTDKALMHLAVLMQMTLPGAPTLYYGDEAGQVGFTDPDNRRTFPWGREDWELIQFHKDLIRIHKKQKSLKMGSFKMLDYGHDYVSYGRFTDEEQMAVAVNTDYHPMQKLIPVWELGVSREETVEMEVVFTAKPKGHSVNKKTVVVENGILFVEIPAKSGLLIRSKK